MSNTSPMSNVTPPKRALALVCFLAAFFACTIAFTATFALEEAWATNCPKCGSSDVVEDPADCYHYFDCEKCGSYWVVENHSFTITTEQSASTCVKAGTKTVECDICGKVSTSTLPLAAHKFGGWTQTKAPTEQAEGEKSRSCSVCGTTETMAIPKLKSSKSSSTSKKTDTTSKKKPAPETTATTGTTEDPEKKTESKTDSSADEKKSKTEKKKAEDPKDKTPAPATDPSADGSEKVPAAEGDSNGGDSSLPIVPMTVGILAVLTGIGYGAFRFFAGAAAAATPTVSAAAGTAAAATAAAIPVGSLISWDDRVIVSYLEHNEYGDKLKDDMDGKSIIDLRPATFGDVESLKKVVNEDTELIVMSVTESFSCDDALALVDSLRADGVEGADSADGGADSASASVDGGADSASDGDDGADDGADSASASVACADGGADSAGDGGTENAGDNGAGSTDAESKINTKIDPCVALVIPESLPDQMARAAELDESDDILTYVAEGTGTNKAILGMIAPLFKSMLEPGELPSHISNVCCILDIPVISDVSTIRFYSKKAIKTVRRLTR